MVTSNILKVLKCILFNFVFYVCMCESVCHRTMTTTNITNISTKAWGPHGWKFLHYVAHGCPDHPSDEEMEHYKAFFTYLKYVLPCNLCRDSYNSYLITNPIRAQTKHDLCRWLWEIHNMVNAKLGVTYGTYGRTDFDSVYSQYEQSHKQYKQSNSTVAVFVVATLVVVCALFSLVKMAKMANNRNFYLSR